MTPWYRDRDSRWLIASRYLPSLAALSLVWEIAQLPLYMIWYEAGSGYLAFALVHCTLGDVLIGLACLLISLTIGRERGVACWHWLRVAAITTFLAVSYTIFSEWINTSLYRWTYSSLMPSLQFGQLRLGLSPLAQWVLIVPLCLLLTRRGIQVV